MLDTDRPAPALNVDEALDLLFLNNGSTSSCHLVKGKYRPASKIFLDKVVAGWSTSQRWRGRTRLSRAFNRSSSAVHCWTWYC